MGVCILSRPCTSAQQTPERPDIFLTAEDNFGKSKATEKVTTDLKGKCFLTLKTHHCYNKRVIKSLSGILLI